MTPYCMESVAVAHVGGAFMYIIRCKKLGFFFFVVCPKLLT